METKSNQDSRKESKTQPSRPLKFRQQWDENYKGTKGELVDSNSQTIPNMSMTCRELLLNHSRGIGSNVHEYDENTYFDTEIPRFDDLNDLKDYKENLKHQLQDLENEIETQKNADILNKQNQTTTNQNDVSMGHTQQPPPPTPNQN